MKFSCSHFEWYLSELTSSQLQEMSDHWSPTAEPELRGILEREMELRNV